MANIYSLLFGIMFLLLTDARLDMTFIGSPTKITSTTTSKSVYLYCFDVLSADGDIVQEFGRVIDTGTGATGNGASGPSDYGNGPDTSLPVPANLGLPNGSTITNNGFYLGQYLVMPSNTPTPVERIGVFYCDTNTTDERNDQTRIQFIMLAQNAAIIPLKRTVTVISGESVMLEMQATNGTIDLRWLFNGSPLAACDDQSSCNVSLAGIYECYYDGQHELGIHGITRVIVRDCPAEMWDPSSGCDKICLDCINGGVCDDKIGDCVCAPGFTGTYCELACGANNFGTTCDISNGASVSYFCMPDPYGCSCATGYGGLSCESACDGRQGHFGADCAQECHCVASGCNQFTGKCDFGDCTPGWSGPNCQYRTPSIVSFTNKKVNSGERTTFTCVIEASPRPLESQVSITQSGSNINFNYALDPDNGWLVITSDSVTVNIGESYTCTVSNSALAGGTFATIPVDLFVPPTLVKGPDTSDIDSTQVTVRWAPWSHGIDFGDGPVSMYRAYYRLATQSNFTLFGETTATSLTVTGLNENTTYHFAITAYRDTTGWGDYSPSSLATTLCSIPGPVLNLAANEITDNSVYLRWQLPNGTSCVTDYIVGYELTNRDMCQPLTGVTDATTVGGGATAFNYTGLEPYSQYTFKVEANTNGGIGDTVSLQITTRETAPTGSPTEVGVVVQRSPNITFSWSPVECGMRGGEVTTYEYRLENSTSIVDSGSLPVETEKKSFDIDSQQPYIFTIRASTWVGSGDYSQPFTVFLIDPGCEIQSCADSMAGAVIGGITAMLAVIIALIAIILVLSFRHGYLYAGNKSQDNEILVSDVYKEMSVYQNDIDSATAGET